MHSKTDAGCVSAHVSGASNAAPATGLPFARGSHTRNNPSVPAETTRSRDTVLHRTWRGAPAWPDHVETARADAARSQSLRVASRPPDTARGLLDGSVPLPLDVPEDPWRHTHRVVTAAWCPCNAVTRFGTIGVFSVPRVCQHDISHPSPADNSSGVFVWPANSRAVIPVRVGTVCSLVSFAGEVSDTRASTICACAERREGGREGISP